MEKIVMIDDDKSVLQILQLVVARHGTVKIAGTFNDPIEALDEIKYLDPDIVIIDLLMPGIDGIEFIKRAKKVNPNVVFIMLSQVTDDGITSSAYEAGVEFFIHKPINSVEVLKVIDNVCEKIQYKKTVEQMTTLITGEKSVGPAKYTSEQDKMERLKSILSKIGILGHSGADDIITICEYAISNEDNFSKQKLKDVCAIFSDTPKSMEQRIRRAAGQGLNNLASIGLDDFSNEYFNEYASSLYGFEQVKSEMNYIQGKASTGGTVKLKEFIRSLLYHCTNI
ncbi:MAG: DNA-binding domain-containing protein [Firmicutes bacterium]|nr:DNA-binding domain-containing protein [Bacillota bacterium]